jgi:uracil phosphoribosyltransferase
MLYLLSDLGTSDEMKDLAAGLELKPTHRRRIIREGEVAMIYPSVHPLVRSKLTTLRDKQTRPPAFRSLVRHLAMLLAQEATADLPTCGVEVATPLGAAEGCCLADAVAVVPILRAGLGMADGILDLIPEAEVWHLGLYRDEETLHPTEYYNRLPPRCRASLALIVDPMLATGGSAVRACEVVKASGIARIKVLALIAAPEGISRMANAMPDVPIHVGVIDKNLNSIGFICPGLGDAGDRQFNTQPA